MVADRQTDHTRDREAVVVAQATRRRPARVPPRGGRPGGDAPAKSVPPQLGAGAPDSVTKVRTRRPLMCCPKEVRRAPRQRAPGTARPHWPREGGPCWQPIRLRAHGTVAIDPQDVWTLVMSGPTLPSPTRAARKAHCSKLAGRAPSDVGPTCIQFGARGFRGTHLAAIRLGAGFRRTVDPLRPVGPGPGSRGTLSALGWLRGGRPGSARGRLWSSRPDDSPCRYSP